MFDVDGCPIGTSAISTALLADLSHTSHGKMPPVDFFSPTPG